jgi:adenine-specific DNA-methyltransferase
MLGMGLLARALTADPSLAHKVWKWLDAIQMGELLDEGRVYGGGLHKMEPNELANVKAPAIQALLSAHAPEQPVQHTIFEAVV